MGINNLFNKSTVTKIIEAMNDSSSIEFLNYLLLKNYTNFFSENKIQSEELISSLFSLLKNRSRILDSNNLLEMTKYINNNIFHTNNDKYWYSQFYKTYKAVEKPYNELLLLEPYINGNKVLDFGSGKGYLSNVLSSKGYSVFCIDVLDSRNNDVKHLPFMKMVDNKNIPYENDLIDTTIIKTVLHHVNSEDLSNLIGELYRISKRVIVIEDIADDVNYKNFHFYKKQKTVVEKYSLLSKKQKINACILIDFIGNALAQGIIDMNFPFNFKTTEKWVSIFENYGFSLVSKKQIGFSSFALHGFFQVLLVFDRKF